MISYNPILRYFKRTIAEGILFVIHSVGYLVH